MESLKTKTRRIVVVPKKKKTKKKLYFGMEVQDAIVRYNDSNNDSLQVLSLEKHNLNKISCVFCKRFYI